MRAQTATMSRSDRGGQMRFRGTPITELSKDELIVAVEMLFCAWEESQEYTARVLRLMRESMDKARAA